MSAQDDTHFEVDLLTSKGQNGGGVTFANGRVFGIYTDVADNADGTKQGMGVKINEAVVGLVDGM